MEDPLENTSSVASTHCRFCGLKKSYIEILDLLCDLETLEDYRKIVDYLELDFLDLSDTNTLPKTTCEQCYDVFQETFKFFKNLNPDSEPIITKMFNRKKEPPEKNFVVNTNPQNTTTIIDTNKHNSGTVSETNASIVCPFCHKNDTNSLLSYDSPAKEYQKIENFFIRIITKHDHTTTVSNSCINCFETLRNLYNFLKTVKHVQESLVRGYNVKTESLHKIAAVNIKMESTRNCGNGESWNNYQYGCCHCPYNGKTMEELRSHSKKMHNKCYAFKCADCSERVNNFGEFVDHVRKHRSSLNIYCQYCNQRFPSPSECESHVHTHYIGLSKICGLCGEVLPYANTLAWHTKLYAEVEEVSSNSGGSWDDYEWSCQECPTRVATIAELRIHTQRAHGKGFAIKCADCDEKMADYKKFVVHVVLHRPYLKYYCQYCNTHFSKVSELNHHILRHITSQQRPCTVCGQRFRNNLELADHKNLYCRTGQKEVKLHPTRRRRELTTEDLTCKMCLKRFDTTTQLRRHIETHNPMRRRDYVCQMCEKAFMTPAALRNHIKLHGTKTITCEICNKKFHTKRQLKNHIITHSDAKPFVCDECGNSFRTKKRLKCHLLSHSTIKPYKCMYCYKEFKFVQCFKTHQYQHTGERPYSCELCDRTFTNWTNCNKHMIRKHGITLAKTKITPRGRVSINRKTGEAKELASDSSAKEWLSKMLLPERRGKKPGVAAILNPNPYL